MDCSKKTVGFLRSNEKHEFQDFPDFAAITLKIPQYIHLLKLFSSTIPNNLHPSMKCQVEVTETSRGQTQQLLGYEGSATY